MIKRNKFIIVHSNGNAIKIEERLKSAFDQVILLYDNHYTLYKIAKIMNISLSTIHRWCRGKSQKDYQSKYYQTNKEKKLQKNKQWYLNNKIDRNIQQQEYYYLNKDKIKIIKQIYNKQNYINISLRKKQYYLNNKSKILLYAKKYKKNKYNIDINYKLSERLRNRIYNIIKNNQKVGSAVRDLGCSIEDFKKRIEMLWLPNMSWQNYGQWHLDHIIPLSSFDLTDRSQFLLACNFRNIQPLWAKDNLKKGKKTSLVFNKGD